MKNKLKCLFVTLLAMMIVTVSVGPVEVKAASKLGKQDFVYTVSGKKKDFIKSAKNLSWAYFAYSAVKETAECKGSAKNFKTNRKVKEGSTLAFVRKKYGSQKKKKITSKTGFYKGMKYDEPQMDISSWKSYLAYNYKNGNDRYQLIFCFNKKNKVSGIVYMKNPAKLPQYPNKSVDMGIKFTAPKGKKVTTKKIAGKKVYLLPKGTTVSYDEKKSAASGAVDCSFQQYSVTGKLTARSDTDGPPTGKLENCLNYCYLWDSSKGTPKYKNNELQSLNINSLGNYRFFTIYFFNVSGKLAPQIIYFKFV